MTESTTRPVSNGDDEPTDMTVNTFDPEGSGTGGGDPEVDAVDDVVDALPGGGRLDEPEDDLSDGATGPMQVP